MYWVDDEQEIPYRVPDDVVDVAFSVRCKALPLDHAYALSSEIRRLLPWFGGDRHAGLHLIHGAESGNGWYRPEDGDDILYLSRRAKLILRLPRERVDEAMALTGQTLDVAGYKVELGKPDVRSLTVLTSVYARYVILPETDDEERFLELAIAELRAMGIRFKKVLSGRASHFAMPDGGVKARSLLVGGLTPEDSIRLQQEGLGDGRQYGFGLFIPHKPV